jgi:hypothetical protein
MQLISKKFLRIRNSYAWCRGEDMYLRTIKGQEAWIPDTNDNK